MPALLAIESSAHVGAVCLLPDCARPECRFAESIGDDGKHSAWLLPAVERVFAAAGRALGAIDAVAFGAGPGAFTGVRTACATAQALAYAWHKPLVAVDSLAALAQQAIDETPSVQIVLDARMGEVYCARFERSNVASADGQQLRRLTRTALWRPAAVPLPPGATLIGSGAALVTAAQPHAALPQLDAARVLALESEWATGVARVAAAMLAHGLVTDAVAAEPIYVRNNVAQTEAERLAWRQSASTRTAAAPC